MKKLIEFIKESLILEKFTANDIINKLSNDTDLSDYVNDLNSMLDDNDARQILVKAFSKSDNKDAIDFTGQMKFIPVRDLHTTQNEIDVNKSIGYPFLNNERAEVNMKRFFENSDKVSMPFPLITFNSKFILDGHHRWSQVYAFNPECKMQCFDISIKNGQDINEQDALKICQGVLAAKRARDKQGKLPISNVEGANLFKMTEKQVKDTIKGYCDKYKEPSTIIMKAESVNSKEELADKLSNNLMDLQKNNKKYANRGNSRNVMPQTDKGGDDIDNPNTARPDKEGSALYIMVNGKISPKILPKK